MLRTDYSEGTLPSNVRVPFCATKTRLGVRRRSTRGRVRARVVDVRAKPTGIDRVITSREIPREIRRNCVCVWSRSSTRSGCSGPFGRSRRWIWSVRPSLILPGDEFYIYISTTSVYTSDRRRSRPWNAIRNVTVLEIDNGTNVGRRVITYYDRYCHGGHYVSPLLPRRRFFDRGQRAR